MTLTGIQLTTVGGSPGMPAVAATYSGPTVYARGTHPFCSDAAVKSVHFNTVHNCEQLGAARAPRGSPLVEHLEGAGLASTSLTPAAGGVGQSLPASYRSRGATGDSPGPSPVHAQPSTPTATINRHYAVQPRALGRPGLDAQPPATTACRGSAGAVPGCPASMVSGQHLSAQCTVSDSGCVSPPTTTRLRHYCV